MLLLTHENCFSEHIVPQNTYPCMLQAFHKFTPTLWDEELLNGMLYTTLFLASGLFQ